MLNKNKSRGQALVEFALAATLIFFLLAAAVDLGFMFFAVQGLHNAAQEGGMYGSRWLTSNETTGVRTLDANVIRDNVRHESGSRGGIGFVNLLDLNNDGTPDVNPDGPIAECTAAKCQVNPATGHYVVEDYIQVAMIKDANLNGDPLDDGAAPTYTACTNSASPTCYIYVSISFNYRLVFPLSPTFTRERLLKSSFTMRIRDDMARSGASSSTPIIATLTPTPQVLAVSITSFYFAPANGNNVRPMSIKVHVTLNGTAYNTAFVSATTQRGSTPWTGTLNPIGNGDYIACSVGSYSGSTTGSNPDPKLSVTASNSTGASASAALPGPTTSTQISGCP